MGRHSIRSTILMLSIAIPVVHFLVERNKINSQSRWQPGAYPPGGFQPPPGYPPLPPGWNPYEQGWPPMPPGWPQNPQDQQNSQNQQNPQNPPNPQNTLLQNQNTQNVGDSANHISFNGNQQPLVEVKSNADDLIEFLGSPDKHDDEVKYEDHSYDNSDDELKDEAEEAEYVEKEEIIPEDVYLAPVARDVPAVVPEIPREAPQVAQVAPQAPQAVNTMELFQQEPKMPQVPQAPAPVQAQPIASKPMMRSSDRDSHLKELAESNSLFENAQAALQGNKAPAASDTDLSDLDRDAKKALRKQQRKAERLAEKNGLPPPDYEDEGEPIAWEQEYKPYSVLEGVEGVTNVLNCGPDGVEREPVPIMTRPDYIEDVLMDRIPPMKRSWYDDLPEDQWSPLTNYGYFLNPYDFCSDQERFLLLVIVQSPPWNFDRRKIIRQTWMTDVVKYEGDVKVIFSTGVDYNGKRQQKLREESTNYGDILQSDVKIDASNSTKQYLAAFNWADVHCPNAKYILSIHDDVVPFLDAVVKGPAHPPPEFEDYRWLTCGKRILRPLMDDDFSYLLRQDELKDAKFKRQFLPATCTSHCAVFSRDVMRILLYGSVKSHILSVPDMDLYGVLREKYALIGGSEMPGAPYLCQHVEKRGIKALEMSYDYPTVEERIAAAWENTKTSRVGKHILERLEAMAEKRDKAANGWREL